MALSTAVLAMLALVVGTQWHPLMTLDDGIAVAGHQATAGHDLLIGTWSAISHWGGPEMMRQLMVIVAVGLVLGRRFVAGAWLAGLAVLESFAAPAAKLVLERPGRPGRTRSPPPARRRSPRGTRPRWPPPRWHCCWSRSAWCVRSAYGGQRSRSRP